MDTTHDPACACRQTRGLERVRYFPRQLLTADDMRAEQEYARERQRRFNRFVIGWGVVCGLEVELDPDTAGGIKLSPGYALSPAGDEIYVPELVRVSPRPARDRAGDCVPAASSGAMMVTTSRVHFAIRYSECLSRPVRTSPSGCGCDDTACEYSRLRDGYEVDYLSTLPTSHSSSKPPSLCEQLAQNQPATCPPCPKDAWVVLATLEVTTTPAALAVAASTSTAIVYTNRRRLVNAALVQDQVIASCCENDA